MFLSPAALFVFSGVYMVSVYQMVQLLLNQCMEVGENGENTLCVTKNVAWVFNGGIGHATILRKLLYPQL